MSSAAARFAGVAFVALLRDRPLRSGVGSSAASPFVFEMDRFASLPEAFGVDVFVNGLATVRFGVSTFLRLEERGESSMVAVELIR
jgi:hypothetical protein